MSPGTPLRIAVLGGVPPSLGGGGLEVQIARTADALARAGNEVIRVAVEPEPRSFDILHAFGAERDVWHPLEHWRRNQAPLVVSPVVVVAPGLAERRLRLSSHLPLPAFGPRHRVEILRRADAIVALTYHERWLLGALAGRGAVPATVIGNGVDPAPPEPADLGPLELPESYVLLLGAISPRKRQAETVAALGADGITAVVVGGVEGGAEQRAAWERVVSAHGARWLGEVGDTSVVHGLIASARALVHLSSAEGQSLAVLEALAAGTPALVSPLPSHRELADAYPGHVSLVDAPSRLPSALAALRRPALPAPVPSWDDVAKRLVALYRRVLAR